MRISTEKGSFDLPTDLVLEMKVTNPFIEDKGTQSIPFKLPPTAHNLALTHYPHRIDHLYRPISHIPVVLQHNHLHHACMMEIHTASVEEGIQATLYWDDSSFYSRIDRVDLQSLDWGTIKGRGRTTEEQVADLIALMKRVWQSKGTGEGSDERFVICTAITKHPLTEARRTEANEPATSIREPYDPAYFYDQKDSRGNVIPPLSAPSVGLLLNEETKLHVSNPSYHERLVGEFERTLIMEGTEVAVGKGFAITPFLRVEWVLTKIFATYGYTYKHPQHRMKRAIVLNGVLDAIYGGVVKMWQLLPNVPIKRFLSAIERTYGGRFIIEEVKRVVTFETYQEVLDDEETPMLTLTPHLTSPIQVEQPHAQRLSIHIGNATQQERQPTSNDRMLTFSLPKEGSSVLGVHSILDDYFQETQDSGRVRWHTYTKDYRALEVPNTYLLNSTVIKPHSEDEEQESTNDNNTDILLGEYGQRLGAFDSVINYRFNAFGSVVQGTETVNLKVAYQTTVPIEYARVYQQSTRTMLQAIYERYAYMLRHSNTLITCRIVPDLATFEQLKRYVHLPMMLHYRRVWIERMEYTIGDNDPTVRLTLRMIDPYV